MSANPRIVIPRKLQKFEMKYENDQQRALREWSVLQDFKNEIEMAKLKTEACIEIYRKIDAEIEEIILSKCSGPVADLLFEQWRMNVQKNEDISHKRWSNNDKWLKSYEAEFLKTYEHENPFCKEGNSGKNYKRTFVDVVNSNQEGFGQQGRPPNSKFTPNGFQNRPQNSLMVPRTCSQEVLDQMELLTDNKKAIIRQKHLKTDNTIDNTMPYLF